MTEIESKNIEIAKMLGWYQEEGHHPDTWFKKTQYSIIVANDKPLCFEKDANWQFDAIEWIENIKLDGKRLFFVHSVPQCCMIRSEEHVVNAHRKNDPLSWKYSYYPESCVKPTRKEAIFDALYKFSQHIKNFDLNHEQGIHY